VIRSDSKNYDFLNILSMNFVSPLPPEIASKYFPDSAEFRKNFPSSGPYYVDSYQDGQKLVLKKANSFKPESDEARKAYVDEIVVDFTANSEDSIVQKIEAGEAELSLYLGHTTKNRNQTFPDPEGGTAAFVQQRCGQLHHLQCPPGSPE
jgi:peptide/nickel transport system substrate-binding protein